MPAILVDSTGLATPRLPEVRARLVELWKAAFGEGADTSSTTPDGLEIDVHALLVALVWQGLAQIKASASAREARGVFLDAKLDLFGRRRVEAAPSRASLVWYGTDATPVNAGSIARTSAGNQFATDEAATIGGDDTVWAVRIDTVSDSTLYRVTVDAVNYDYTSDASATLAEIRAGVQAALDAAATIVALQAGTDPDGLGLVVFTTTAAAVVSVTGPMTRFHAVRVASTATVDGPTLGQTGLINIPVSTISGVTGITSTDDAVVGNDIETDGAFFSRHLRTLSSNGARSPEAVAHRLMDTKVGPLAIDDSRRGVEEALVIENESVAVVDGRPGKSFETYVDGDDFADAAIAEIIWQQKTHGAEAFGTTVVVVLDTRGNAHSIGFTRVTKLYGHLEVTIVAGEGYPTTGTPLETIRLAVGAYYGNGGAGKPRTGQDFYRGDVNVPARQAVPGINSVTVRTATTTNPGDPPTFAAADIVVPEGTRVIFDSARVTVL